MYSIEWEFAKKKSWTLSFIFEEKNENYATYIIYIVYIYIIYISLQHFISSN